MSLTKSVSNTWEFGGDFMSEVSTTGYIEVSTSVSVLVLEVKREFFGVLN